jgi:hypothetical protein
MEYIMTVSNGKECETLPLPSFQDVIIQANRIASAVKEAGEVIPEFSISSTAWSELSLMHGKYDESVDAIVWVPKVSKD